MRWEGNVFAWNWPVLQVLFVSKAPFGSAFFWHVKSNNKQHNFQKVSTVRGCSLPSYQHCSSIFQISESWCQEMWGHVSQSKGFTVWAWTHALLQMKLELSPHRYFVWWGLKVSENLKYHHFFQANPCETFSTCLLAIISKFNFMVYSYKENKLFLPTFPIGNIWLKCGLHVVRVHSHSSPGLQGLCKPLWNVPRPLRHPHPGREKTVWYLSYIVLPTLLLRGIRDILLLFCLWPSIALQSLFFPLCGGLPTNMFKTGQCHMEIFRILIHHRHEAFSNLKNG